MNDVCQQQGRLGALRSQNGLFFNRPGITNNTAGILGRVPTAGWRAW